MSIGRSTLKFYVVFDYSDLKQFHQVSFSTFEGYNRNRKEIEWYLGEGKLQTKNCNGPYASCRKLSLPGLTLESSGHWFYCKGTELKEASWASVQINVTGE